MTEDKTNTVSIRLFKTMVEEMRDEQTRVRKATGVKPTHAQLVAQAWTAAKAARAAGDAAKSDGSANGNEQDTQAEVLFMPVVDERNKPSVSFTEEDKHARELLDTALKARGKTRSALMNLLLAVAGIASEQQQKQQQKQKNNSLSGAQATNQQGEAKKPADAKISDPPVPRDLRRKGGGNKK